MECVLVPCFNAQPNIFAVMNCCVVALSLFSSDILTWSADSLYSVQKIKGSACRRKCILCQQTSPKRWFGNMNMTSNCDVTNSGHQPHKWPPHATEWKSPMKIFCVRHCSCPTVFILLVSSSLCNWTNSLNLLVRNLHCTTMLMAEHQNKTKLIQLLISNAKNENSVGSLTKFSVYSKLLIIFLASVKTLENAVTTFK